MKLEKLQTLQRQLRKEFSPEWVTCTVYFYFEDKWRELASQKAVEDNVAQSLRKAKSESIAYHVPSSPTAWFYFPDLDFAVSLEFPKSPQIGTRKRYRELIVKAQVSATNSYKVTHHSLTHLLAKDAFREILEQAITELNKQVPSSEEAQESGAPRTLAVMALDIDHFKQVNDTWGHLYGDQVLKTFGIRLEKTAEQIITTGIGSPSIFLGHPSGEEFLILVMANAARQQFADWANKFRLRISEDVLPTDKEWLWLKEQDDLASLVPPPLQERAITTSVGVALHTSISPVDASSEPSSSLLGRADTALYRAKAAGRNIVTFFDEILSLCGRVLEQDANTRVVAIDIGSNVGVVLGQEFRVFPPTFTGQKKFSINDGRTIRTLGTYPRVESARIVVFNSQPEISFAYIATPEDADILLESGSHLEAIPAGSIGHLLTSSSKYFPAASEPQGVTGLHKLQEFVKKSATGKGGLFAVAIRFTHEAEYLRKYGTASLNMALARLYRAAQTTFHAATAIEVLDRGSICIVGTKTAYKEAMLVNFIDELAVELPELGLFAGVFCEADYASNRSLGGNTLDALDAAHAIDFARFAASDYGRPPDTRVRHFSPNIAASILQALRDARSFDTAYADFGRLRSLGVETSKLLNIGGLIAGSLGLKKEAAEHYSAAMNKDPSNLIYKSNFAVASNRLGDLEPALKVMNALSIKDIDQLKELHAFGYVIYARLLAKAKLTKSPLFIEDRFTHVAKMALTLPESEGSDESKIILDALAMPSEHLGSE